MAKRAWSLQGGCGASSQSTPRADTLLPASWVPHVSTLGIGWGQTGLRLMPNPVRESLGLAAAPLGAPWGGSAVGVCVVTAV